MRRALTTFELRRNKIAREEFLTLPRRPITVVLDGVTQNYNIGAVFRLCDAFLVQQLVICGTQVDLRKRRLVQAAQGTQHWVPWSERQHAAESARRLARGGRTNHGQRSARPTHSEGSGLPSSGRRAQRRIAGCFTNGRRRRRNPNARHGEFAQRRDRRIHPALLAFTAL